MTVFIILLQITPAVVRDLNKSELEGLGVTLLGDQKRLRNACSQPAGVTGKHHNWLISPRP